MNTRKLLFSALIILLPIWIKAQDITSVVRGKVMDIDSEAPLPFAAVTIEGTNPQISEYTDEDGNFELTNVPIGRWSIVAYLMGYEPAGVQNVLITSGKVLYVEIKMKETITEMETIVLKAEKEKEKPLNKMATVSARQLSIEEASKFAGGFDDPARLVASYAGVASDLATNGIVIRGNSPKGLLWRLEGVEVPNPNHFGEISGFGAGGITALSSQMLANSDFFTGAFPAEYGNALSGVFDLSMRRGNMTEREHTIGIGTIGVDVSSEGPLKKGKNASYLFNYRYSSLALVDYIIPGDLGINYQDLAYKFHIPTKKFGVFAFWGMGFIDHQKLTAEDSSLIKYDYQYESGNFRIKTGISGLTHRIFVGENTFIKSIIAGSANSLSGNKSTLTAPEYRTNSPIEELSTIFYDITLTSLVNHKFSAAHTNRSGFIIKNLNYNIDLQSAPEAGLPMEKFVDDKGNSYLYQIFSQSSFRLKEKFIINPGLHVQYFHLSGKTAIEPRLGAVWEFRKNQSLSFGYGKHSRIEKLNFYLSEITSGSGATSQPNKSLDFSKAHHFVLGYDKVFGKNTHLRIEPYYQYLYDIPVIPDSSFSFLNLQYNWFINKKLTNDGKGENIGVDITLERFLNQGWFYLITASVFDSKYKGGDGVWRNTRFNRNFLSNILLGKEWVVGKSRQNQISASARFIYMKGSRWTPVDVNATEQVGEIVYQESRAFEERAPDSYFLHITLTYRKNKKNYSGLWSLQVLNTLGAKNYTSYEYNLKTNTIEKDYETIIVPNLSYKIQF